jgi:hypothetical protein
MIADAVAKLVAVLDFGDVPVHTGVDTPRIGPCVVVGLPSITGQDGMCAVWSLTVPVRLLPATSLDRDGMLALIDDTARLLADAGYHISRGGPAVDDISSDSTVVAYDLDVDIA